MVTYQELDEYLGRKTERPWTHRSTRVRRYGYDIVVKLHNTDIVRLTSDNIATLNSGGWRTPVTKDRLNLFAPVETRSGFWYVMSRNGQDVKAEFYDGIQVQLPHVAIVSERRREADANRTANAAMNKRIVRYVNGLTPERLVKAFDAPPPAKLPTNEREYLLRHMDERCYTRELIKRAVYAKPSGFNADLLIRLELGNARRGGNPVDIKRSLRKYLRNLLYVGEWTGKKPVS